MSETHPWALLDDALVVVSVQIASQEWINANPAQPPYSWHLSPDPGSPGYAGLGFTLDEATGWYIPPQPGPQWVFDRELWRWVDPTAPANTPTE